MSEAARRATLLRTLTLEVEGLQALHGALEGELGARVLEAVALTLALPGRVIVTGMGKSGHVGRKIAATLASTGTPAHFVHPAEASHGDLGMIGREDAVLALSWSGEAPELADIIAYTRRFDVKLIAITSRPDSALGSAADILLALPRMPEACPNGLAPTTSTTMQLALGDALAMALLEARGFSPQDFREFHPGGKLGARLKHARDLMHGPAELPLVPPAATLEQAIVEMTSRRFGVTGVVEDGRLVGVLTDGDLRRAFQRGLAMDRPVAEAMTRTPRTAAPEDLAPDLLGVMNEKRITSLFVVEDGRPVGILHLHDLLRAGVM
ncbi:KpsF/GutQ family sugar-phosphate isomerase [Falsiroseomonas oryziterrae]|uniref:KpsF/GutQ family sugar-phosphate isomerase n=1 Tax=Falsiroseomonas oryziterrae TaxID=2911368 RepID=UPI001F030104|nr:KpsF/GutQ family sugar-phosphate isomerase [Roseomonas sp. NPKOSM-4]